MKILCNSKEVRREIREKERVHYKETEKRARLYAFKSSPMLH